jgi:hypothetical protein
MSESEELARASDASGQREGDPARASDASEALQRPKKRARSARPLRSDRSGDLSIWYVTGHEVPKSAPRWLLLVAADSGAAKALLESYQEKRKLRVLDATLTRIKLDEPRAIRLT